MPQRGYNSCNCVARPRASRLLRYPACPPERVPIMNKILLQQIILQRLSADLLIAQRAAQTAYEAATDAENIAENKYDTLGLEASYLATGQARRMNEISQALQALQRLPVDGYQPQYGIRVGDVVLLADADDEQRWLLLASDAAGLKVELDNQAIMLITPHSPMGQGLLGQVQDSEVMLQVGNRQQHFLVLAIY